MIVNSIPFLLFFAVVFVVYYLPISRKAPKFQNLWLFLTSYFFYGYVDWSMIPLLLGTTIVFYGLGLWLKQTMDCGRSKAASRLTALGVVLGVGLLLYFKYLNFFADSFAQLLSAMGLQVSWTTLNIVLPVGVSFFTFKLISYIIEIHREHILPCKDFITFGTYMAFFPTILSGPIDRPNKFIPQLYVRRTMDAEMMTRGLQQILWGMFKKMVIADNLMGVIDSTWEMQSLTGSTYVLAAMLYPIQMYADFSGYSDMAIGVGRLLGIKVAQNFNYPFFARNVAEYWRRWHISLTGWLTDYVFSPLNIAFRNHGNLGIIFAVILNMVLVGLWHGANWTFGLFGLYHGLLFIPLILSGAFAKRKKLKPGRWGLPKVGDFLMMCLTYLFVAIGLVVFKADSIAGAWNYFSLMTQSTLLSVPRFIGMDNAIFLVVVPFVVTLFVADWRNIKKECPLFFENSHRWKAVISYLLIVASIYFLGAESASFIYFQF